MTPSNINQLQQNYQEQLSQDITQTLYLEGVGDAAMGESPKMKDSAYLDGYFSKLRALVEEGHSTLHIRWLSEAYLSGSYDDQPYDYSGDPF